MAIGYSGGRALVPLQSIVYRPSTDPGSARCEARGVSALHGVVRSGAAGVICACRAAELEGASLASDIARWSTCRSIPKAEMQKLVACLNLLVEHFQREIEREPEQGVVVSQAD